MNHYRHDRTQIHDLTTTTTTTTTTTLPPQQQQQQQEYPSSPPRRMEEQQAEPAIEAVRVVEWFPFPQTIDDEDDDKIRQRKQQRWKCLAIFCVSILTIALGVNLYLLFT